MRRRYNFRAASATATANATFCEVRQQLDLKERPIEIKALLLSAKCSGCSSLMRKNRTELNQAQPLGRYLLLGT
ncbi:hypothetical protein ASU33_07520 [Solirubrum puertoriconensis]|uniref:Uncharacterized protein n=1 Tax=Solirubrum puertoriconensis TaxID=1751427 RepID=A0A9X0HL82_SOLP1|nr:hypothetical protein ASU33_07520 [Solirubrum puertoriconensis]